MSEIEWPSSCPKCQSKNIDSGFPNQETPYEPTPYICLDCFHKWSFPE